jgi:hypothetical protein
VKVEMPTVVPGARTTATRPSDRGSGSIEVKFPGGVRVRVHGAVDVAVLKRVFEALSRR